MASDKPQPFFIVTDFIVPACHIRGNPRATATSQEETLHLSYKRYVPRNNLTPRHGDITLIAAHATGFPKELYEPLWEDTCRYLDGSLEHDLPSPPESSAVRPRIRAIWIADVANHSSSFALNEHKIGDDPDWLDHSRDLLHFVNTYRRHLPRPLFGIGHSMGANQIVGLALLHPRLFEGVVLLDPVMQDLEVTADIREGRAEVVAESRKKANGQMVEFYPFRASAVRRTEWPSREKAGEAMKRNAFYRRWDPRVVDLWLQYGLRPKTHNDDRRSVITGSQSQGQTARSVPGPAVTLSTPPAQEVQTFVKTHLDPFNASLQHILPQLTQIQSPASTADDAEREGPTLFVHHQPLMSLHSLAQLRPRALYIFGARSPLSTAALRKQKIDMTGSGIGGNGGNAANIGSAVGLIPNESGGADRAAVLQSVVLEGVGHLVAMEDVDGCAKATAHWLESQWKRFTTEQDAYRAWSIKPLSEKQGLAPEWLKALARL